MTRVCPALMMAIVLVGAACRSKPSPSAALANPQTTRSSPALESPPAVNAPRTNAALPKSIASVRMMQRADIMKSRLHQRIQPLGRQ